MKKNFNLTLPWMYFNGIKSGDITVLFFDRYPFEGDIEKFDLITFSDFNTKIKMYFKDSKILAFKNVTEDLAKKAGFANKDLLAAHLIDRFNITSYTLVGKPTICDELFYMLVLTDDPNLTASDGEVTLKFNVVPGTMAVSTDSSKETEKGYYLNNLTLNDEYIS